MQSCVTIFLFLDSYFNHPQSPSSLQLFQFSRQEEKYTFDILMAMTLDVPWIRLSNQQLISPSFEKPAEVVSWFGAMQSQDFAAAKWAIAQRLKNHTDQSIEQAFNNGDILRTHVMRPTWHFVTPKDIRWLLALTAPRVQRFNGHYYRQSGLDKTIFQKSNTIIQKALQNGKQLTRDELKI